MEKQILQLIQENQYIIISRHKNPDLDAYGSQFGLYYALKNAFPEKEIHVVGDSNALNQYEPLHEISNETISKSLLFVLDTVARQMLLNDIHDSAKTVVLIDHHQNDPDIRYDIYMKDVNASSTSEMVAKFLQMNSIEINIPAAGALFSGIIGDTGRFLYSNTSSETYRIAADLIDVGVDVSQIFNNMYTESFKSKQIKAEFFNSTSLSPNNVAFRKNDKAFLEKRQLDSSYASRGLVNQMAGIKEVPIWVNFTYNFEDEKILVEIRAREIPVLSVAKNHGGGGHLLACGCTVETWEETNEIIKELDYLVEVNHG